MADCNTCKEKKKSLEPVPYIVHEAAMARQERNNKRLWIVVIILIAALILSNAAWVYYESQFTEEVQEVTQDVDTGDGDAIVSGIGDVNYGESQTDSENETPSP